MDVIELTSTLIRHNSTSGDPGEAAALLAVADLCRTAGLPVRIGYDDGLPVALLAGHDRAVPHLLFAVHVDVVPADRGTWSSPPFEPHVDAGRLYGRGASDMKSGLAAALIAVSEAGPEAPVMLGVTTSEETGCRGAAALAELLGPVQVGAVIVPESTGNHIALGHRGALWVTVRAEGMAAHGSTPGRGVNAIAALAAALVSVDDLPLQEHPMLGRESVNIGTIRGGSVPNIVPDACEAQIDMRTVGETGALLSAWRAMPGVAEVEVDLELDAVWTDPDHPFVRRLSTATGVEVLAEPVAYFTDAAVLSRGLPEGVPFVILGPGDPTAVHGSDESVSVAAVRAAERIFRIVVSEAADLLK